MPATAMPTLDVVAKYEAVVAMVARASYNDIRRAIHIHPTLSEGINAAAGGVHRETGT